MKHVGMLLVVLFPLYVFASPGSDTASNPELLKNASMIWIKGVSFQTILDRLDSCGYEIKEVFAERRITTKRKFVEGSAVKISLHIRYVDGIAQIIGQSGKPLSGLDKNYAYTGPTLIPQQKKFSSYLFDAMNNFALALNGTVWYGE